MFAAFWLTACTYPVVALTLPVVSGPYYLWIAETFAPLCECTVFLVTFGGGRSWRESSLRRDTGAILAANLASLGWAGGSGGKRDLLLLGCIGVRPSLICGRQPLDLL